MQFLQTKADGNRIIGTETAAGRSCTRLSAGSRRAHPSTAANAVSATNELGLCVYMQNNDRDITQHLRERKCSSRSFAVIGHIVAIFDHNFFSLSFFFFLGKNNNSGMVVCQALANEPRLLLNVTDLNRDDLVLPLDSLAVAENMSFGKDSIVLSLNGLDVSHDMEKAKLDLPTAEAIHHAEPAIVKKVAGKEGHTTTPHSSSFNPPSVIDFFFLFVTFFRIYHQIPEI